MLTSILKIWNTLIFIIISLCFIIAIVYSNLSTQKIARKENYYVRTRFKSDL